MKIENLERRVSSVALLFVDCCLLLLRRTTVTSCHTPSLSPTISCRDLGPPVDSERLREDLERLRADSALQHRLEEALELLRCNKEASERLPRVVVDSGQLLSPAVDSERLRTVDSGLLLRPPLGLPLDLLEHPLALPLRLERPFPLQRVPDLDRLRPLLPRLVPRSVVVLRLDRLPLDQPPPPLEALLLCPLGRVPLPIRSVLQLRMLLRTLLLLLRVAVLHLVR